MNGAIKTLVTIGVTEAVTATGLYLVYKKKKNEEEKLTELKESELSRLLGDSAYMQIVNFLPTEEEQIVAYDKFVNMVLKMWHSNSKEEILEIAENIDNYMIDVTAPYLNDDEEFDPNCDETFNFDACTNDDEDESFYEEQTEDYERASLSDEARDALNKGMRHLEESLCGTDEENEEDGDDGMDTSEEDLPPIPVVRKQGGKNKNKKKNKSKQVQSNVQTVQTNEKDEENKSNETYLSNYAGAEEINDEHLRKRYFYTFCNSLEDPDDPRKDYLIYILQNINEMLDLDIDAYEDYQGRLDDYFEKLRYPTSDFNWIVSLESLYKEFKKEYEYYKKQ